MMNIYEKLGAIQQELKAPKNQYNDFGHYSFRSCEDILEAVKPLLKKNKCVLQLEDYLENIGDRYYVRAIAKLIDTEKPYVEDNEICAVNCITNSAYAREEESKKGMDGSQITGASSSYARKYALNGLFLTDDVKDSDTTNTGDKEDTSSKLASEKQIIYISSLIDAGEIDEKAMFEFYRVNSLEGLTMEQASEIIKIKSKEGKK